MKKIIIAVLALISMAGVRSQAQSINVTYQGGTGSSVPNMVDSQGAALANTDPTTGLTVELGYFDVGYDIAGNAGNLQALASHWHLFGATYIQTFFGVFPGAFSATSSSADTQFNSQHIELWVFKTSDNSTPTFSSLSSGNVLEYGLFTRNDSTWVFPNAGFTGNSINIDTSQVNQNYFGTINTSSLQLAAVPEPSSLALVGLGLGLCGFIGRRLRR